MWTKVFEWLDCVPHYDFIVTLFLVLAVIYLLDERLHRRRMNRVLRKMWNRRHKVFKLTESSVK